MRWAGSIWSGALSVGGVSGIAGLLVHWRFRMLFVYEIVLMAILALAPEYVSAELELGKFPFLRHETL